jgi:hypothetical protein
MSDVRGRRRDRVDDARQPSRVVTVSGNRQVGLATEFARAMGLKPKMKLIETLVRLPGGYGVLLTRAPRSHADLLGDLLGGASRDGVDATVRALRDEWERPAR